MTSITSKEDVKSFFLYCVLENRLKAFILIVIFFLEGIGSMVLSIDRYISIENYLQVDVYNWKYKMFDNLLFTFFYFLKKTYSLLG